MDELVGRALGPYELLDRIGTGGMASVYRGVHRALGQPRAIKILLPALAADASLVERFRSEAKIASGLRHPNIVSIYDVGEQDGLFYLVMDLVEGVSLGRPAAEREDAGPRPGVTAAAPACLGAGLRPRAGHRAPRRQGGQRAGGRGRPREPVRLRDRAGGGVRPGHHSRAGGRDAGVPGAGSHHRAPRATIGRTSTRSASWRTRCWPGGCRSRAPTRWRCSTPRSARRRRRCGSSGRRFRRPSTGWCCASSRSGRRSGTRPPRAS